MAPPMAATLGAALAESAGLRPADGGALVELLESGGLTDAALEVAISQLEGRAGGGGTTAAPDVVAEAFGKVDADGSGSIDAAELAQALREAGCAEMAKEDQVEALLAKYDADGSGEIELDEFIAMVGECQGLERHAKASQVFAA